MKAIIQINANALIDNNGVVQHSSTTLEVVGSDLTLETNPFMHIFYVHDKGTKKNVFYCKSDDVQYAHIVGDVDD